MLVMVVCDIRGELFTDGYWELFWICLASANIVPPCPLVAGYQRQTEILTPLRT